MNYTKNHRLPQWTASDRVRMEDFNQMNQSLESSLDAAAGAASEALEKAEEALASSGGSLPYFIGSYTGTGPKKNHHFDLPFDPSLIIISGMTESLDATTLGNIRYLAVTGNNNNIQHSIQFIKNGFIIYPAGNYDYQTPDLNELNRHYDYIAFR